MRDHGNRHRRRRGPAVKRFIARQQPGHEARRGFSRGQTVQPKRCYTRTPQANAIFNQINSVYDKVEDLVCRMFWLLTSSGQICKVGSMEAA
jgi:hypothetical protein